MKENRRELNLRELEIVNGGGLHTEISKAAALARRKKEKRQREDLEKRMAEAQNLADIRIRAAENALRAAMRIDAQERAIKAEMAANRPVFD